MRIAERALGRGEEVHQHAEREDVAAEVAAHAEDLLRRHIGRRAVGQAKFLVHQVGQKQVAGKAVVDQHGLAGLAKHDVRRFDVEMDDVLTVQVDEGRGDPAAERGDLLGRPGQIVEHRIERFAGEPFEHDIGLGGEIAVGDEARHMAARETGQDHLFHLETDDHCRIGAGPHFRHLHQHGEVVVRVGDAEELRHAAAMGEFADREAVNHVARMYSDLRHALPSPRIICP